MLKITKYGEVTRFDLARTLFGRGRYWTTAYLVDDVLVDSGCAHCAQELIEALVTTPLRWIVNTHTHEDHIGTNGLLQQQQSGLEIKAHPRALPILSDPRGAQPLHPYRRVMWGWPQPSAARSVADGEVIETERRSLQVVFTPGHSLDHICLFAPREGWLFTGDLFVGGRDRALRAGYDIWQIIASLKRVTRLQPTVLFPGCARVRTDAAAALGEKIAYLEKLGERVRELDQQGKSVSEIVRLLCGGPMLIELFTLWHFSRRRLVLSYLGKNQEASRT